MSRCRLFNTLLFLLILTFASTSAGICASAVTSGWIVVYKNSGMKTLAVAHGVGRRVGKTRHEYKIIPGLAADFTPAELAQIKQDSSVAYVAPDAIRHLLRSTTSAAVSYSDPFFSTSPPIVPYGIDLVHARDVWPYTMGSGVKIADIDTGIDLTHPDIATIIASTSFTSQPVQDSDGHGTHTAGTMAAPGNAGGVVGVAPQAGLLIAQVFDSAGNANDSDIIAGIDWAVQNGAQVINMSLGGSSNDQALSQACANAVAAGAVVVAAAGNDGTSAPSYPADYPSVIAVAAIDMAKQVASFSNYGSSIDLCAPGVGVLSTVPVNKGWLATANWNSGEHQVDSVVGSSNGTLTAGVLYCGLGNPTDFPAGISGKIAHIRRGTLTFQAKVNNAIAAGATGVIISDNIAGESLSATLSENASVVVVGISKENGDDLQANDGVTATITNQNPSDYTIYDGTSMATPHVSGVAALLVAARHGQVTPAQVRSAMEASAEDLGATGRDQYYGYGLVNAKAALGQLIPVEMSSSASPTSVAPGGAVTVTVNLSTSTGLTSLTANGVSLSGNGNVYSGNIAANSAIGAHAIDVAISDQWGNVNHDTSLSYTTVASSSLPGISISAPSVSSTNTGPVSYTVTYSNATNVTLSAGDVTLNATGTAAGTISVTGSGAATRTVTVSGITGVGTLGISIAAGTASNTAGNAPAAGPSATFSVITPVPSISISAPSVSSTSCGPVSYTITYFNATSVTLSAGDVVVNSTGTGSGTVFVSGTGVTTRMVTIAGIGGTGALGSGTLGISIAAGTATNTAGIAPAAGPSATFAVTASLSVYILEPDTGTARCCPDVSIAGDAGSNTAITQVTWQLLTSSGDTSTGACSAPVSNDASWTATGLPLSSGLNLITVTATDNNGMTGAESIVVTYTSEQPGSAWQGIAMVSLPIIPDQNDPLQVVGFSQDLWYQYDTVNIQYLQYPNELTWFYNPSVTPGRGFWASFPASGQTAVCGVIPDQTQAQTIQLFPGWNLIGQPFIKSITWDVNAIRVQLPGSSAQPLEDSADVVADYVWGWDPTRASYYVVMDSNFASGVVGSLAPWQAYWIRAYQECNLILPPP